MQRFKIKDKKFDLCNSKTISSKLVKQSRKTSSIIAYYDMKDSTSLKIQVGDSKGIVKILTHNEFCKKIIESYNGKVIKELGDGLVAVFPIPSLSFCSAIEIVHNLKKYEKSKKRIQTKVAISYGEFRIIPRKIKNIDEEDVEIDDVFGQSVDLCARILSKSDPNTIFFPSILKKDTELVLKDNRIAKISKSFSRALKGIGKVNLYKISLS